MKVKIYLIEASHQAKSPRTYRRDELTTFDADQVTLDMLSEMRDDNDPILMHGVLVYPMMYRAAFIGDDRSKSVVGVIYDVVERRVYDDICAGFETDLISVDEYRHWMKKQQLCLTGEEFNA